jgi:hypothetical protein
MRRNLRRTLDAVVHDKSWVHNVGDQYTITRTGQLEVEARGWLGPIGRERLGATSEAERS